jgi:hypothetical protein
MNTYCSLSTDDAPSSFSDGESLGWALGSARPLFCFVLSWLGLGLESMIVVGVV